MSKELTIEERMDLIEGEVERQTIVIRKLNRLVYKLFMLRKESMMKGPAGNEALAPEQE